MWKKKNGGGGKMFKSRLISIFFRWDGEIPICSNDVAKNKPTFQSSLTSLSSKPILPSNVHIIKHEGNNN